MIRWLGLLLALIVLAIGGWLYLGGHSEPPATAAADRIDPARLRDPELIARGEYLTLVGDCAACHTAQGGPRFAGGRVLPTPFGNIPAPNITPDPATGLGDWSFAEFWQALHSGKGRHGELLYPAFSYTSFTKVSRDDALAIFAYLKSLPPVDRPSSPLGLKFPYDVRSGLTAWRALYFREGVYQADPQQSAAWNRGAYLVQGLGHCNECHVARDALGGMNGQHALSGGQIPAQDWYAPDLSMQANGGLAGWSEQDVVDLLKTGQSSKGVAFGPMAEVVTRSTQHLRDDDLHAIAIYLQSLPARSPSAVAATDGNMSPSVSGKKIYDAECADCHGKDGTGIAGVYPPLKGNSAVLEPSGINAVRMVLLGGFAPTTVANPRPYSMPPFAQKLNDVEVAAVVSYVRHVWGNQATAVPARDVGKYRQTPIQ